MKNLVGIWVVCIAVFVALQYAESQIAACAAVPIGTVSASSVTCVMATTFYGPFLPYIWLGLWLILAVAIIGTLITLARRARR